MRSVSCRRSTARGAGTGRSAADGREGAIVTTAPQRGDRARLPLSSVQQVGCGKESALHLLSAVGGWRVSIRVGQACQVTGTAGCADRHCCIGRGLARAGWADASPSRCPSTEVQLRRVPVPARGDHAGGALVPAVRAVLPRCGRATGRTRHRGGSRHDLPVGAAVHPGVARRRPPQPARRRGSLVRRRDLPEGRWAVGVPVSGDRPARAGHRRPGLTEAGSGGDPPVLCPGT